jgi:hypothetical protein
MSKVIQRFYHILEENSDAEAIDKIVCCQDVDVDFDIKEATKIIKILSKAKDGLKIKTSDSDFVAEYGPELNVVFPPSAVAEPQVEGAVDKNLEEKLNSQSLKIEEQSNIIAELKKENHLNVGSGNEVITLTMLNGEVVTFKKVEVPADKIEEITMVPKENGRRQEWLNEYNLDDLLKDYKAGIKQVHPGLGYGSLDSIIYVLDGSRRRKARIEYNREVDDHLRCPFVTYIPEDPDYVLSNSDALFISNTAKKQKELSSVERGLRYFELTTGVDAIPQADLALSEQISPSLVSELRKVVDIPNSWLNAFPDVYSITDSHIKKLCSIESNTPKEKHGEVEADLIALSDDLLSKECNIAKITTEIVKGIEYKYKVTSKKSSCTPEPLWSSGKSSITVENGREKSVIILSKLPANIREVLLEDISTLIKRKTEELSGN